MAFEEDHIILPLSLCATFLFAGLAPWIWRAAPHRAGAYFGAFSAALCLMFARQFVPVSKRGGIAVGGEWAPDLGLRAAFYLDGLSLLFAVLVTGVGALILIYTGSYLKDHPQQGRFFSYLWLFTGAMLGLVLAGNLVTLFVFWELTSFASYLLIGFQHKSERARAAALQAFLTTSLGGLALMAALVLIGNATGTTEFPALLKQPPLARGHPHYIPILALVCLAAFTKSAQFPFHFWLPNAMEAPTPASAFLHSATMVKAGIFLLARMNPVLGGTPEWRLLLSTVGAATLGAGASLAILQADLKRILAYSTVSALGFITLLLGIGTAPAVTAALVFLVAHAAYKAALFLAAGAIEHETGERRITRLSGLAKTMPVLAAVSALAAISFGGAGPVLSFVGKELAIASLLKEPRLGPILIPVVVASTALYVTAALLVAYKPFYGSAAALRPAHDPPLSIWICPGILSVCGLVSVFFLDPFSKYVIAPAVASLLNSPAAVSLSVWHGFNRPLALSAAALAFGALVFRFRGSLHGAAISLRRLARYGPEAAYGKALEALKTVAAWQTRILQNGRLRLYLMVILLTTTAFAAVPLLYSRPALAASVGPGARFHEMALVLLIAAGACTAIRIRSRLAAVASLGVTGYGVALLYTFFSAPDLAMTQFLIETLTVVLLLRVLFRLPRFAEFSSRWVIWRDGIVAVSAGTLVTILVLTAANTAFEPATSQFFIENSWAQARGRNIVNVIIVDFRAMDTLGEITVLSTAALGVFGLLHLRGRRRSPR